VNEHLLFGVLEWIGGPQPMWPSPHASEIGDVMKLGLAMHDPQTGRVVLTAEGEGRLVELRRESGATK
jgi:hypothetical protein